MFNKRSIISILFKDKKGFGIKLYKMIISQLNKRIVLLFLVVVVGIVGACNFPTPEKLVTKEDICEEKEALLLQEYLNGKNATNPSNLSAINLDSLDLDYSDIAPIFSRNCVSCHKEGGNGPFALDNYLSVKKRSRVIKEIIDGKYMPPWMPDDDYTSFFNAPEITDSMRVMIINWMDKGCKPSSKPIPAFEEEVIVKKEPDLVLTLEKKYTLESNEDSYICFIYDPKLEEDVYISGIEFVTDNPEVAHHMVLSLDTSDVFDNNRPCWECGEEDFLKGRIPVQTWSRGMKPYQMNDRFSHRINKGSRFILQIHYSEGYEGKKEQTTIKLYYSKNKPKEEHLLQYIPLDNMDILYKANEITTEHMSYYVEDSVSLIGLFPHAHFLTKKVEVFAVTPKNEIIPILKISHWDYYWQGQYIFDKPTMIPSGSTIYNIVVIDNTTDNKYQPNDPPRDAIFGLTGKDEMLVLVLIQKKYLKEDQDVQVGRLLN
jgi:hypothetical protein